jgi:hypothetical protein
MTMLGGVLPRDEIATPGESFTGEFRSAGREQHSAIRSALAQPLPGGKQVVCCIVSKAEADQRTLGPHEACPMDDREQRVCRHGRDDRYAWPSDNRVIEVAAVPRYGPCPRNT